MGLGRHIVEHGKLGIKPAKQIRFIGVEQPPEEVGGGRKTFSTSHKYLKNSLMVFVNGVNKKMGVEVFEGEDLKSYTFAVAPREGDVVWHSYSY